MAYRFRPARLDDLPLLRGWIAEPHVRQWWGEDDPFDAADLADPAFASHIVALAGRPFAYIQDYRIDAWPDHHLGFLPAGSRGIDQFIGPPDMIGQGHGSAFIAQHIAALLAAGAPAVGTDPNPENRRAVAAYRRAGLETAGEPTDTPWGRVVPMAVRAA